MLSAEGLKIVFPWYDLDKDHNGSLVIILIISRY